MHSDGRGTEEQIYSRRGYDDINRVSCCPHLMRTHPNLDSTMAKEDSGLALALAAIARAATENDCTLTGCTDGHGAPREVGVGAGAGAGQAPLQSGSSNKGDKGSGRYNSSEDGEAHGGTCRRE